LLINFGFWIGSLWGDPLMLIHSMNTRDASLAFTTKAVIPATAFSILWAVALLATGIWAVKVNRRWLVNLVAVFAGTSIRNGSSASAPRRCRCCLAGW